LNIRQGDGTNEECNGGQPILHEEIAFPQQIVERFGGINNDGERQHLRINNDLVEFDRKRLLNLFGIGLHNIRTVMQPAVNNLDWLSHHKGIVGDPHRPLILVGDGKRFEAVLAPTA
jgi:hypothetical protein